MLAVWTVIICLCLCCRVLSRPQLWESCYMSLNWWRVSSIGSTLR